MLRLTLLLFCTLLLLIKANADEKTIVYQFDIKEEIGPPIWRKTLKAFEEAKALDADIILIRMNTYGGLVLSADSIRTKILNCDIPVYIFIENNAASAGAFIALACDSVYMKPGCTIGAATVVNQEGEPMSDKHQSYMRTKMRATAEQTGRNPDIAEAMVDADKIVEGISREGKVLTLTTSEAIEYGFCEAEVLNVDEIFNRIGITNYELVKQHLRATDGLIDWLISPAISGVLIMIIMGGIYFELQTPGIGFPIVAAMIAAAMYFAPLYLEGLADNWEILVFFIGLILLAAEVLVIPGFGVAGVLGIVCVISGLSLSMVGNVGLDPVTFDPNDLVQAVFTVVMSTLLSVGISLYFGKKIVASSAFSHAILESTQTTKNGFIGVDYDLANLKNKIGVSATILRPSGKVAIDGKRYDATAQTGFIELGDNIKVVGFENAHLVVKKV